MVNEGMQIYEDKGEAAGLKMFDNMCHHLCLYMEFCGMFWVSYVMRLNVDTTSFDTVEPRLWSNNTKKLLNVLNKIT